MCGFQFFDIVKSIVSDYFNVKYLVIDYFGHWTQELRDRSLLDRTRLTVKPFAY